jgi:hypothetical protein
VPAIGAIRSARGRCVEDFESFQAFVAFPPCRRNIPSRTLSNPSRASPAIRARRLATRLDVPRSFPSPGPHLRSLFIQRTGRRYDAGPNAAAFLPIEMLKDSPTCALTAAVLALSLADVACSYPSSLQHRDFLYRRRPERRARSIAPA